MRYIRNYLVLFLTFVTGTAMFASCSDEEEGGFSGETKISATELAFAESGGTQTLSIASETEPQVVSNQDWCSVAFANATQRGTYTYDVIAEANTETEARTATLSVTAGSFSASVQVTQEAGDVPEEPKENIVSGENPYEIAASLGLGWNLGNQLDAHNNGVANETAWGNRATTQALFDQLAASGITSVRIPVTWLGHVGEAPDYTIEADYLNRVAEVVGYAENAGLNAIINIHHDGADSQYWLDIKDAATDDAVNEAVKAQLKAMWTQIAERFKDKGNFLVFEAMNEIHDGGWGWGDNRTDGGKQYAVLNEWNQVFVDAVRATGGNNTERYLGLPGYVTNIDLTVENFVLPTDAVQNRLMVAVHFYDPNEYTLSAKFSEWGHTGDPAHKETWGDEDNVRTQFGKMKSTFIDKGIPAYIGEMGCVHRNDARAESFRLYYLEYVCKAAKDYGLAPFYWDNGGSGSGAETSGLFNHATGEMLNNAAEVIEVMKRAVFSEDASYTLQSVYDAAPQ